MNKGEAIERLEELLERVRARAGQPRRLRAEAVAATEVVSVVSDAGVAAASRIAVVAESAAEEPRRSDGYDSRERLLAAEPAAAQSAAEEQVVRVVESVPPIDMADVEVAEDEEPPASSRRTVASPPEERLEQMAFGADEPRGPLHTPPPESGRLPAAQAAEFDPDVTGVRNATPLLPRRGTPPAVRELEPEAMRPQLVPSDAVAEMIAEAQRFAPATFVALLEASLSL